MKQIKKIPKNVCLLDDTSNDTVSNKLTIKIRKKATTIDNNSETKEISKVIPKIIPKIISKTKIIEENQEETNLNNDNKLYEFELIIDNNEKKNIKKGDQIIPTYVPIIFERFNDQKGVFGKHHGKINLRQETLPIGDIRFDIDGKPFIIIERKTAMDLHCSIEDKKNRYHDQKMRIMNSDIPIKYYLVEGSIVDMPVSYNFDEVDKNKLYSAIIHTTIRDQIPVLRTFNMDDTLIIIEKILETLIQFKNKLLHTYVINKNPNDKPTDDIIDYSKTIKMTKKDNITPEVCYLLQLRQIPGVSHASAQEIVKIYPTMKELIGAYNLLLDTSKKEKMLQNIMIPSETTGKTRKLGPAVSARIASYLA